jgi:integrase
MKLDPYKHKERYLKWKEETKDGIEGLEEQNFQLLKKYLSDMEMGLNIASGSVKGPRGFSRLNTIKDRFMVFARSFKKLYGLDKITDISENQLIMFFTDMRNGVIKTRAGGSFKSAETLSRIFKAFWHWWMKASKKQGIEIKDITIDLDTRQEKPNWVYLNEEQVKKLCNNAKYEYKVLIMFLFDTGIRAPTELMNVKVSDLFNKFKELNIREETSKTFGRRIKLMICSQIIEEFVKEKGLKPEDYLFGITPSIANQYLKRLAERVLGGGESPAGAKYSELTMYDFRHISCCYWLPRYKSESALKYRFGWKKSDKIHYYSELLGMSDTIAEEDMLIDVTKTEIEKRLERAEKENLLIKEDNEQLRIQFAKISELTKRIYTQMKVNQELDA